IAGSLCPSPVQPRICRGCVVTSANRRGKHRSEHDREDDPNAGVPAAKRLDHYCLAFSIQRIRNNGHSAVTPGKIIKRKPALAPRATGSTAAIPTLTKAAAKMRPSATYAKATLRSTATTSHLQPIDRDGGTGNLGARIGSKVHQHARNLTRL